MSAGSRAGCLSAKAKEVFVKRGENMQEKRMSARVMRYEEGSMGSTPMIVTGALLKRESIPEGYHCYDIQADSAVRENGILVAFSRETDQADGSIILAKPLDFGGKEALRLEGVRLYGEESMIRLKDFMMKTEEQTQAGRQEIFQGSVLSM